MNRDLEDALARVGYDSLYERFITEGLRPENSHGERAARSPFPFSNDNQASFSVNVRSGLWKCWHSQSITGLTGGNYVQFIALMNSQTGPDGRPVPDYAAAERDLRIELGLSRAVDETWLARTQMALAHMDSPGHQMWIGRKPWHHQTLTRLGIGYDADRRRLVIPVADPRGRLANCRMYQPGGDVKMLWAQPGLGGNFLFPHSGWTEPWVVLVEGEPDAISLRCFGYNGVSGTMGSGNPVPEGRWWVGKQIFIWMDGDEPGREATRAAVGIIRDGARDIRVVNQPTWDGAPSNADPSDFISHLFRQGMAPEQVQREITRLLSEATVVDTATTVYDATPVRVDFRSALTSANAGQKIAFTARTLGKSSHVYQMASHINITCPGTGHSWCNTCVMHTQWHGNAMITLDPRAQMTLKLVQTREQFRDEAIKHHMHIPPRCPDPRFEVTRSVDIEVAILGTTMLETEVTATSEVDRRRHEALLIIPHGAVLEDNIDYDLEGFVYPAPKSQQQIFLLDKFTRRQNRLDAFTVDEHNLPLLQSFIPKHDIMNSLADICMDLEQSHTGIKGRLDLHAMFRSVWHSVLAFNFGGALYKRGWLEAIILGDTRCGKSATFRRMAEMYGTGMLVDCKMQTPAGMLGAVETSVTTGERFVIAGLYPQQDGTGPLCMDEFSYSSHDHKPIMDYLSSTRAEGMVRVTKAAHATFMARVRAIWMGNPGAGRLMRDMGGHGVEVIQRLIRQPEDIARFDLAMCVCQEDVPIAVVNTITPPTSPRWTGAAHQALLAWTWSRKPDQIIWADGAEEAVIALATIMSAKYDSDIPIVEPADQRMRVAKLCVSIASQCFSTDETYEYLVVRTEHVAAVAMLYTIWYDKKNFGYDVYAQRSRIERTILNENEVETLLDRVLAPNNVIFAEKLMRMVEFTERTLGTVIPMNFTDLHGAVQTLCVNRCFRPSLLRRDAYETTPSFVEFLRRYIEKRGGGER